MHQQLGNRRRRPRQPWRLASLLLAVASVVLAVRRLQEPTGNVPPPSVAPRRTKAPTGGNRPAGAHHRPGRWLVATVDVALLLGGLAGIVAAEWEVERIAGIGIFDVETALTYLF